MLLSGLQGSASADDVMGAATHFLQEMAAEELSLMLKSLGCTTIEADAAALQSEQGRTAAVGWILNCPECTPQPLLQLAGHTSLQNYLLGETTDFTDATTLSQSQCVRSILQMWGRSCSGGHVGAQVSTCLLP